MGEYLNHYVAPIMMLFSNEINFYVVGKRNVSVTDFDIRPWTECL